VVERRDFRNRREMAYGHPQDVGLEYLERRTNAASNKAPEFVVIRRLIRYIA